MELGLRPRVRLSPPLAVGAVYTPVLQRDGYHGSGTYCFRRYTLFDEETIMLISKVCYARSFLAFKALLAVNIMGMSRGIARG